MGLKAPFGLPHPPSTLTITIPGQRALVTKARRFSPIFSALQFLEPASPATVRSGATIRQATLSRSGPTMSRRSGEEGNPPSLIPEQIPFLSEFLFNSVVDW